jgi:alkylation response protein AidB-like acyl-CoA dehydrogenase
VSRAVTAQPKAPLPLSALDAASATEVLLERLEALSPLVRERAREAEAQGRVTDDVFAALEASEVFKALTPRRWGGLGLGLRCLCEAARTVARADASTAWVTCFLMEHNWMACRMGPAVEQALFGDGRGYALAAAPLAPGGTALRVPGGFRISGTWRYASGVAHSQWTFVSCVAEQGGEKVPRMFLLPVSQVRVLDEWHTAGMRATSSTNLSATDVFVPEERSLELQRFYSAKDHPGAAHPEPFYRYPLLPGLLVMLSAVALGSAEGALANARARMSEAAPWGVRRIDRPLSRARLVQAHQDVRCAGLLYEATLARTCEKGDAEEPWSLEEQGQHDLDVATVVHRSKDAIASLLDGCGSSAWRLDDPLQRALRDVLVVASHLGADWDVVTERAARWLLGFGRAETDPLPPRPAVRPPASGS